MHTHTTSKTQKRQPKAKNQQPVDAKEQENHLKFIPHELPRIFHLSENDILKAFPRRSQVLPWAKQMDFVEVLKGAQCNIFTT